MPLSTEGFLQRLRGGRGVRCVYRDGERQGLISAWLHDGTFMLTWEECRDGDQYDESLYTRDEVHRFATAEDVLAFLEATGRPASSFTP